jgi:UDP-GlcNAc3NAcA epimerase
MSSKPKIVTVVGARPQFIKAAEVSRAFAAAGIDELILHTGQHYDHAMSEVFFEELGIPKPKHHLGVGSGPHGAQTGSMLEGVETVLAIERPDGLLVYGDTNSTLAGAIAAAKMHVPVFHVEAGLRSFNRRMPEEINRVLTDHVSDLLFCPTSAAVENLRREGADEARIALCGDVMFDSVLRHAQAVGDTLPHPTLAHQGAVLVTLHRAENTDDPGRLSAIVSALVGVAASRPVVFPVHPRTRAALSRKGLFDRLAGEVACIQPLSYRGMIAALKRASLVVTDSGGVQKEAFFLGTPSLVVRRETEWVELVEHGCTRLVEPEDIEAAAAAAPTALPDPRTLGLYGDGNAAGQIRVAIEQFFA